MYQAICACPDNHCSPSTRPNKATVRGLGLRAKRSVANRIQGNQAVAALILRNPDLATR